MEIVKSRIRKEGAGRKLKYPFATLKIGRALAFSKKDEKKKVSIMRAAYQYAARHGKKFKFTTVNGAMLLYRLK